MCNDSGKKLQTWAKLLLALAITAYVILACIELNDLIELGPDAFQSILIVIVKAAVGILVAWIAALGMTAVGETHEKTVEMQQMIQEMQKDLKALQGTEEKPKESTNNDEQHSEEPKTIETPAAVSKVCPRCKKENPVEYLYCQYCGERLN